jgi:hypothetical protein
MPSPRLVVGQNGGFGLEWLEAAARDCRETDRIPLGWGIWGEGGGMPGLLGLLSGCEVLTSLFSR